jgi:hypothetical protein
MKDPKNGHYEWDTTKWSQMGMKEWDMDISKDPVFFCKWSCVKKVPKHYPLFSSTIVIILEAEFACDEF